MVICRGFWSGRVKRFTSAIVLAIALIFSANDIFAAQIAGVPPALPPDVKRQVEIYFGNDFFGDGGDTDDFRTQQLSLTAAVGERWMFVIDHSILTLEEPQTGPEGRLDQLSGSLGYRFFIDEGSRVRQTFDAGIGFRYSGDIAGARIQNGFHQIINNEIKTMPYVDTERVDGTLWAAFDRTGVLKNAAKIPLLGAGWQLGYWGRGATMLTTDAQWDGDVRVAATAGKRWFQSWLGVQANWREGYDRDNVQQETARNEDGTGIVFGLRFGPIVIETEQQFNGDSSSGHMSFISTGEALPRLAYGTNKFSIATGLTLPDITASLQGRWTNCNLLRCGERWQRALMVDVRYGKPQFGSDVDRFVETIQVAGALEFERPLLNDLDWMTVFASAGIGWRSEQLQGEGDLGGQQSETVERFGLVGDTGVRFSTSAQSDSLNFMIQFGLSGWLPSSDGTVEFAGENERLQSPQLVLLAGLMLEFL